MPLTAQQKAGAMDRFAQSIVDEGDHAIWQGRKHRNGTSGVFRMFGKAWLAHRASYELFEGHIPEGQNVVSTCKVPFCVAPAHLAVKAPPSRRGAPQPVVQEGV